MEEKATRDTILDRKILMTSIANGSILLSDVDNSKKLNVVASLMLLSIAATIDSQEAYRLVNMAKNLASQG